MAQNVKVSIITPVKNCRDTIEKTIKSIKSQTYNNIEYIIIDGGSTDGTIETIEKYSEINLFKGKDKSIADAMNKGMKVASGDIIGILNADDYYLSSAIEEIVKNFEKFPNYVLHAGMRAFSDRDNFYDIPAPENPNFLKGMVINHPTLFIPKKILLEYGDYDEDYKIVGDWELCIRYSLAGVKFKSINKIITHYLIGGISTSRPDIVFNEMHKIRKKYKLYHLIDFRFIREKILMLLFGNYVTKISHYKRIILFKIFNILKR